VAGDCLWCARRLEKPQGMNIAVKTIRTRKSAEERKIEIADAAIRLAADIGPDKLTTEKLAREVGISQPGIFRHFPTTNDIWDAVAKRIAQVMKANAVFGEDKDCLPVDRLRDLVVRHLRFIDKTPAIPAILFSRELHAKNEKLRAFFANVMAKRQKLFAGLIAEEIAAKRFDADLDADDGAYLVLALIQGLAMRWSLNNRDFDLVAEGQRLMELQLLGFAKAK
jgi:AcrR family transcriptional regulator